MHERIFLIGFMGTGKTTVGEALAKQLHWRVVDTDEEIVRRDGRNVPEIFEQDGEDAFRRMESDALADAARLSGTVVTTGGGVVKSQANRDLMLESGLVVCLTASIVEITRRVAGDKNRPLLQADDLRGRIEQLLTERQEMYAAAHMTIDTTCKDIGSIVSEIRLALTASLR